MGTTNAARSLKAIAGAALAAAAIALCAAMPGQAWADPTEVSDSAGLQDAINSADVVDIRLSGDIDTDGTFVVPAGKTVTLDLNGNTISGTCNTGSGSLFAVRNTATLNIKDTSASADGMLTYAPGSSIVGWTVWVEGNLNLYSGTIQLTGSWSLGYAVDVRPNSWGTEYTQGTVFHMHGGKLESSDGAVRVASSSSDTYEKVSASFVMDGGEIDAAYDGIFVQQSNAIYDILSVTINNGSISSGLAPIRFYGPTATSVVGNADTPISLDINGGDFSFTGEDGSGAAWLAPGAFKLGGGMTADDLMGKSSITVSSGSFDGGNIDADVSEFLEAGLELDENGKVVPITFTATFMSEGKEISSSTAALDECFAKPTDPTRDGYTFVGWYADEAFETEYDFSVPAESDIILYAKWTKNPSIGGGEGDGEDEPSGPADSDGTEESKPVAKDELAQTGDATGMLAASAGIALVAAGAIALVARRRAA